MRVALLAASMDTLGGLEMVVLRTARHLRATGRYPVLVSSAFHAEIERACREDRIEIRQLSPAFRPGRIADIDHAARSVVDAIADCQAVNVHNFPAHVWLWRARLLHGGSDPILLYSCHEPPRALYESVMDARYVRSSACSRPCWTRAYDALAWTRWRRLDRAAMRSYETVFTNSLYTARCIRGIYGREAIPTWFGAPVPAEPVRPPTPQPGNEFRLLSVSRLSAMKNVAAVVEAMALLGPAAGVRLRVVGDGDRRPLLEDRVARAGLSSCVDFLGSVCEDALESEYRAAHALVYVPFDEPMGLVPMEAALRGVPSIVSDHGGPAEIFQDGESGLQVDPDQPGEIVEAIRRLEGDAVLRRRLAEGARRRVEALHFGFYAALLDQVLAGHPPTPDPGAEAKALGS